MAASVLNTEQAVRMSVFVVRAFVRLRETLTNAAEISAKLHELEARLETHDGAISQIVEAIKRLMQPARSRVRQIGFQPGEPKKPKALKAAAPK